MKPLPLGIGVAPEGAWPSPWVKNMLWIILGAFEAIGVFVFWCDVTDSWHVFRQVSALLPPYPKKPIIRF
jgi:hypothetical protein